MSGAIQQHFLGCSIRNFNLNMGWGGEPTTLTIGLVEDDSLFERFRGSVSQLARFVYDNFVFDGVVSNISEQKSFSGNRVWEVVLTDPREFLSGVQLITGGYTGPTHNVPNLYNIYGYLESFGFGNSLINEAGVPWRLVRDSFTIINQNTPLQLAGIPYFVDLSLLPNLPADFRIGNTSLSLLEFIQQICEMANHDYTVILTGNFITVITVNRNIPILNGSITRLLQQLPQYSNLESGFELQYNTSNKFLVGGQREQIYFQGEALVDRFWGVYPNGNIRHGTLSDNNYEYKDETISRFFQNEVFTIPGERFSSDGLGWFEYYSDVVELRAALDSFETWEHYLNFYDDNEESIHFGKHSKIFSTKKFDVDKLKNNNIQDLLPIDLIKLERNARFKDTQITREQKVYNVISSYASEFLDKQFIVRIPFTLAKIDPDASISLDPTLITSLEPTQSAYIDESTALLSLFGQQFIPQYSELVLDQHNKLKPYVRFGPINYLNLDLSEIPEDKFFIQGNFIFVQCDIDEKIYFTNKATAFSPRAVVKLPGRVKISTDIDATNLIKLEYINEKKKAFLADNPDADEDQIENLVNSVSKEFDNWSEQVGADTLNFHFENHSLKPQLVAVPLVSNIETYGPWYTNGTEGKVEFEQNHDLVPWNYGGFANMNAAGQAIVQDAYVNTMIGESGSVEVPGSPIFNIAQQIFAGGPTINQINTSVGEDGVTTTYRLEKWNRTHSKFTQFRLEQARKLNALRVESSKNFKKLFQPLSPIDVSNVGIGDFTRRLKRRRDKDTRSSHTFFMSTVNVQSGEFKGYSVGSMPDYQIQGTLDQNDWGNIAGCSLDALFTPYTTNTSNEQSMPKFTEGTHSSILNPFKDGHGNSAAVHGEDYFSMNMSGESEDVRSIALKGPLVVAGWGYNTSGNPVPSGEDGQFASGYLDDPRLWKVGPVDLRWNENKGVWDAAASSSIDRYLRDFRIQQVSGYNFFQLEVVENGSGTWETWFATAGCIEL